MPMVCEQYDLRDLADIRHDLKTRRASLIIELNEDVSDNEMWGPAHGACPEFI